MEPLDLDCQRLNARHLRVDERHHPRERTGYVVPNEQQTQTLGRKGRGYILPEAGGKIRLHWPPGEGTCLGAT